MAHGPVVLIILDGVGNGSGDHFDAVTVARTPTLNRLKAEGLYCALKAHGTAVGLPSDTDMGNSEVGHNILGAGRVFDQGAKCIDQAIRTGDLWKGTWQKVVRHLRGQGTCLHLLGLLSDGKVHSHLSHLYALLDQAQREAITSVALHILFDGRDVPDRSAEKYLKALSERLANIRTQTGYNYRIASGGGRMVATMDRYEADWGMVERGWQAHVLGTATPYPSAEIALQTMREANPRISDQHLPTFTICDDNDRPSGVIEDGDAVILFNFRGDRAVEICQAFTLQEEFTGFNRQRVPKVFFAGMMLYDGDLGIPSNYLVSPKTVTNTLSEYLANGQILQFACAETQKFGHVTYFWNGNRSAKFAEDLEDYVEIPSDRVPFNERPWMKSAETADALLEAINTERYRFIRANFAGGDMVGHTGSLPAVVMALESIDLALARIARAVEASRGCLVITADHGNADDMIERNSDGTPQLDESGQPRWRTSHSLNSVPFIIMDYAQRVYSLRTDLTDAGLANVAPTLVELLGFAPPKDYAPSLLHHP